MGLKGCIEHEAKCIQKTEAAWERHRRYADQHQKQMKTLREKNERLKKHLLSDSENQKKANLLSNLLDRTDETSLLQAQPPLLREPSPFAHAPPPPTAPSRQDGLDGNSVTPPKPAKAEAEDHPNQTLAARQNRANE